MLVGTVQKQDLGSQSHQTHAARNFLGFVAELEADSGSACYRAEVDCTETPVEAVATHRSSVGYPESLESAGFVHQTAGSVVPVDRFDSAVAGGSAGTPSTAVAVGPCTAGMDCRRHWSNCLRSTALFHPPNRTFPRFSRAKGVYIYGNLVVRSCVGILQVEFFDRIGLIPKC